VASHADAAAEQLRTALRPLYADILAAGQALAKSYASLKADQDLLLLIQRAGHILLAAEGLQAAAEAMARAGRQALGAIMLDVGCTHCSDGDLSLYLSRKPKVLTIDDPALIPKHLLLQPPPQPDRAAIKEALNRGEHVPGCSQLTRNDMTLTIKPDAARP
jgi:Siphovirus Gp157